MRNLLESFECCAELGRESPSEGEPAFSPHTKAKNQSRYPARGEMPLARTRARRDVFEPEHFHGLIRPEIHADLHRRGKPDELFAELLVQRIFLDPQNRHIEVAGGIRRATRDSRSAN